jgi:TRAP-type uncharacterized transport system substrate-binding protein
MATKSEPFGIALSGRTGRGAWCRAVLGLILLLGASPGSAAELATKADRRNAEVSLMIGTGAEDAVEGILADLSTKLGSGDRRLFAVQGSGAWQALIDLLTLDLVDLGAIQGDHLLYAVQNDIYPDIQAKIDILATLGQAAVHVVSRREFRSIADLVGKRVSYSPGVATFLTAATLFERLGIEVEVLELPIHEAIEQLSAGGLDAAVVVGIPPIEPLNYIEWERSLTLLPLPGATEPYLEASLSWEVYPSLLPLGTTIPTVATPVYLAAYVWPPEDPRARRLEQMLESLGEHLTAWQSQLDQEFWHGLEPSTTDRAANLLPSATRR